MDATETGATLEMQAGGRRLVVFRADASAEIGGGHLMRSLALADAMADAGWTCAFAVRAGTLDVTPALTASAHAVRELAADERTEPDMLSACFADGAGWLVVDHYRRDARFQRACRGWAERILVIDDLPERIHDCDLLLDPTLGRTPGEYRDRIPSSCGLLLGPRYALLRGQFGALREAALARRREISGVGRILVSFGATDPRNLSAAALEGIRLSELGAAVDVVLGRAAPHIEEIRDLAATLAFPVTLHEQVADMAALMLEADVAVGAAGTTSWERCALGLPSLVHVDAANQAGIAEALAAAGAAVRLGGPAPLAPGALARALGALAGDAARLRSMAEAAAAVCDAGGAARVARHLIEVSG